MTNEHTEVACVRAFQEAEQQLRDEACDDMPTWHDASLGVEAPYAVNIDAGEWRHGWQYHACSARESYFPDTKRFLLPTNLDAPSSFLKVVMVLVGG